MRISAIISGREVVRVRQIWLISAGVLSLVAVSGLCLRVWHDGKIITELRKSQLVEAERTSARDIPRRPEHFTPTQRILQVHSQDEEWNGIGDSVSEQYPADPVESKVETTWIRRFDRAMDREFDRIEARVERSDDEKEVAVLHDLRDALVELDALWASLDAATDEAERKVWAARAQEKMGDIIRLGATDRNQRLSGLAHTVGLTSETQIISFIAQVDHIFRETHLDWASLFSRGP